MANRLIQLLAALVLLVSSSVAQAQACSDADFTADGALDFFDVSAFLSAFSSGDVFADLTEDGNLDFFDVSMFLTLFSEGCGPVEYNLRQNAEGVDASCWNVQDESCTDGQLPGGSASNHVPSHWEITLVKIVLTEETTITAVRGVGTNVLDDWINFNPRLDVWTSEDAAVANPFLGDAYFDHVGVALDSSSPPAFGGFSALKGLQIHRYVRFNFPAFTLPPGAYWMSVINYGSSTMGSGGFFWSLSSTDVGSDSILNDGWLGFRNFTIDFGVDPGTAAVDVFGYPTPDTP